MPEYENAVLENIFERRSCKSYKTDPVPEELIDRVIEAGLYAPSGMNQQNAIILAVTDKEVRDRMMVLNRKYDFKDRPDPFYKAPVILVVLYKKENPIGIYDASLVMENMMLAARSLGLGSCWIHRAKEVMEEPDMKKLLADLGLTGEYEGVGNCIIGWPEVQPEGKLPRKEGRVYRI